MRFASRNPATGEVLGEVPDDDGAALDVAVASARAAVDAGWGCDPAERRAYARALHDALIEHADDLRRLLADEAGLPVSLSPARLDDPVARLLRPAREEAGVVAAITPFTSPLAVALDAIGAAVAGGGSVVLKPAPDVPLIAVELGRIAASVLPPGVVDVVTTRDVDVAIALTTDPRVDAVSFTGSAVNGERVRTTAARAGRRVTADLGGVAPLHLDDDGELGARVVEAARVVAAHAGQGCRLPATVVVPAHRRDEAVEAAVETMSAIVPGDPHDPTTVCGPVSSPVQRGRVLRYLALAEAEGGRLATGGHALDRDGWWIAPTVVTGLDAGSRVAREEILGPVLVVVAAGDVSAPDAASGRA